MLLAIDVGNTHTVIGVWEGSEWRAIWRLATDAYSTEDELASAYFALSREQCIDAKPTTAVCASVVPAVNDAWRKFGDKWLGTEVIFISRESVPDIAVSYMPESAVGADRLANAVAVQAKHGTPAIVVDFGTATTFDAIGPRGEYLGGAILPGIELSMEALFSRAAKLPKIEIAAPKKAIGTDTQSSIQSGLVLGYAGAIDALAERISREMGGEPHLIATGGLARLIAPVCETRMTIDETLTLDGIRLIASR
jgi:type III pantothenate kinase